jgi:hypothetical protein
MNTQNINAYGLVRRQLKDIIAQANNLNYSKYYRRDIINFAKYSKEFQCYLINNIDNKDIIKIAQSIPDININSQHRKYWYHYLLYPWYLAHMYNDLLAKDDLFPTIKKIRLKYEAILEIIDEQSFSAPC